MKRAALYFCCFLLFSFQVGAGAQSSSATPGYTEPEIKAAFIFHLMGFVSWPNSNDPSGLCFSDRNAVYVAFASLLHKREANDFTLKISADEAGLVGCDLLFLSKKFMLPLSTRSKPLLTIGESPGFAQRGGMIELKRNAGRVELLINNSELQRAGFSASSRLMSLATVITTGVEAP